MSESDFELSQSYKACGFNTYGTQLQSQLIIWMVAACWAWTEYASSVLCEPRSSYSSVQTWLQFNMVCRGGKRPTSARTTSNDQAARNDRTTYTWQSNPENALKALFNDLLGSWLFLEQSVAILMHFRRSHSINKLNYQLNSVSPIQGSQH